MRSKRVVVIAAVIAASCAGHGSIETSTNVGVQAAPSIVKLLASVASLKVSVRAVEASANADGAGMDAAWGAFRHDLVPSSRPPRTPCVSFDTWTVRN